MSRYLSALLFLFALNVSCLADTVQAVGGTMKQSILNNLRQNRDDVVFVTSDIRDPEIWEEIRLRSKRGEATKICLTEYPTMVEKWVRLADSKTRIYLLNDTLKKELWACPMMVIGQLVAWTPTDKEIDAFTERQCSGGLYHTTAYSNGIQRLVKLLQKAEPMLFEFKK